MHIADNNRTIVEKNVSCAFMKFASHQGIFLTVHVCLNCLVPIMYSFWLERMKRETLQWWIITCQIKHYFCVLCNMAIRFRKYQDCQNFMWRVAEWGWRWRDWEAKRQTIERKMCKNAFFLRGKFDNKLYEYPSFRLKIFQFRWIEKFFNSSTGLAVEQKHKKKTPLL